MATKNPEISIVIPAKNEEGSLTALYSELSQVLSKTKKTYEIVFIDDGSTDNTYDKILKLRKKDKRVKVIKFRGNWGKSLALQAGFKEAKGKLIFTMDADLQDNPKEIPNFLKKIEKEKYDLISGWKKNRHDPWHKVIPSRILNNFLIPLLTGAKIHDTNCGYKIYRKEVVQNLNLYGELYRYIPIIAQKQNYKVGEMVIEHRKRRYGKSKFGIERNLKGFLDLITITFLTGYLKRPAHFFGMWGLASFAGGFVIGLYITYLRLTTGSIQYRHPLLFLGILLMIVGIQLVTTGLLAEMIVSVNQPKDFVDKAITQKQLS
jgi:glycosyltransferase involved in cell wall biosynthesis